MQINGTLVNYYFHCKRQCYLFGSRMDLEDNSELVQIGRALHEEKAKDKENAEIAINNIKIDKLTKEYLTEIKKSDADVEAAKWQMFFYLSVLKQKGIVRKGRLEFIEKKKSEKKTLIVELTPELEEQLLQHTKEIESLLEREQIPERQEKPGCKKCAYFEYCFI